MAPEGSISQGQSHAYRGLGQNPPPSETYHRGLDRGEPRAEEERASVSRGFQRSANLTGDSQLLKSHCSTWEYPWQAPPKSGTILLLQLVSSLIHADWAEDKCKLLSLPWSDSATAFLKANPPLCVCLGSSPLCPSASPCP